MHISIFGLGYVGTISAVCLANAGHRVIGVDVDTEKVDRIRSGLPPVQEKGLPSLLKEVVERGDLQVTTDAKKAVLDTQISLIAVGTPSSADGTVDLSAINKITKEIATALAEKNTYHLIVVRSTVPPGTSGKLIAVIEQRSNKKAGLDFGICMNPEFLREGSALADFYSPPYTVIGASDKHGGELLEGVYRSIDGLEGEVYRVGLREAEMLKYVNNSFHAVKVAFANEIARLCKKTRVDAGTVMNLVVADRKLNISPYYLRPGFAFGGSCLPKDTRAAISMGCTAGVETPLLASAIASNDAHVREAARRIKSLGKRRIGMLGITFKEGTDDLRGSPVLRLIEMLQEDEYEIRLFDSKIALGKDLLGENKHLLDTLVSDERILLLTDMERLVEAADVIVLADSNKESIEELAPLLQEDQVLFDLTGALRARKDLHCHYESLI